MSKKKVTTVFKVPHYNKEEEKIESLKFKNNKKGSIRAFTNAANVKHLKGKPLYLDMSKMISVFADENDTTIIHNGNLGWQVVEELDDVVNIWKNVINK